MLNNFGPAELSPSFSAPVPSSSYCQASSGDGEIDPVVLQFILVQRFQHSSDPVC